MISHPLRKVVFHLRKVNSIVTRNYSGLGGKVVGINTLQLSKLSFSKRSMSSDASPATNAPTSIEAVVENVLGYGPTDLTIRALDFLHTSLDMPYWLSITAFTLAIRVLLIPIGVTTVRNGARMAVARPELAKLKEASDADPRGKDPARMLQYQKEVKAVFAKYKLNPLVSIAGVLVNIPVFASIFFGIRKASEFLPGYNTGGLLWFSDLSAADPTHLLPILNAVSLVAMIEMGVNDMPEEQRGIFKWSMRGVSAASLYFTLDFATGLFVYWTINNCFSVAQTLLLKSGPVRNLFDIPAIPKVQPSLNVSKTNPFTQLMKKLKEENAHPESSPATVVDGSLPVANADLKPPTVTYSSAPASAKPKTINAQFAKFKNSK